MDQLNYRDPAGGSDTAGLAGPGRARLKRWVPHRRVAPDLDILAAPVHARMIGELRAELGRALGDAAPILAIERMSEPAERFATVALTLGGKAVALLSVDARLAVAILERRFGHAGSSEAAPVCAAAIQVATPFVGTVATIVATAWARFGVELVRGTADMPSWETGPAYALSSALGRVQLCYAADFCPADGPSGVSRAQLLTAVGGIPVRGTVRLASPSLSLAALLALQPGSVIPLGEIDGIALTVGPRMFATGVLARVGARRAMQIDALCETPR